jgi:hypothetical protein
MGAADSTPVAPWQSPDEDVPYSDECIHAIKQLSASKEALLTFNTEAKLPELERFSIEEQMHIVQGALTYDDRLQKWLPKLVPKKVSELVFWRNYFSHVAATKQRAGYDITYGFTQIATVEGQQQGGAPSSSPTPSSSSSFTGNGPSSSASASASASASRHNKSGGGSFPRTPFPSVSEDVRGGASAALNGKFRSPSTTVLPQSPARTPRGRTVAKGAPLRWGIVGCGDVCNEKSAPALYKCSGSTVKAVMTRNLGKAKTFAENHGIPHYYDDFKALVMDPEVDAVYIASPPGTHLEYALQVCQFGKPCYVEKPMARSAAECQLMVDEFKKHNGKMIDHSTTRVCGGDHGCTHVESMNDSVFFFFTADDAFVWLSSVHVSPYAYTCF